MNALPKAVIAAIACILAIAAICGIVADSTPEHAQQVTTEQNTRLLTLDTSNAALMHRYGLPTAEDAMQWHLHGQWAYVQGDVQRTYADLPGDSRAWDELYGIDSDNKAFDK